MSTTAETAMSNGFQSRPEVEPVSVGGASVVTAQLVLDSVGPEVQRLVQCRARHDPESVKGHPVAQDVQHPESRPMEWRPGGWPVGSAPANPNRTRATDCRGALPPEPAGGVLVPDAWGSPGHYAIRSHLMKGWQPIQADATWSRASGA